MHIGAILGVLPCTSFKSKIIDAHAHIGDFNGQSLRKNNLDVFVKSQLPNEDEVEKILVSDLDVIHGNKEEYQGNNEALNIFAGDNHYALLASCNPKRGNVEQIKKLMDDNPNKFLGLKFHTLDQKIAPSDEILAPYLEYANKNKIPCLFHTQVNVDNNNEGKLLEDINEFADPKLIYDMAKKYKNTPIVMAHLGAGWNEAHDKAIKVLVDSVKNNDANLYADISWVDIDRPHKNHILKAIKELKGINNDNWSYGDQSFRLMFGTDIPLARFYNSDAVDTYSDYVTDIKTAIKQDKDLKDDADKIIDDLFYNNAKKLYFKN